MQPIQQVARSLQDVTATGATNGTATPQSSSRQTSFIFQRSAHSAGSSTFSVEVSVDGVTWITYNKLISNVANTNVQNLTRVASVALSSNTAATVSMDKEDTYPYMRVSVNNATDGTANAWIVMQY